MLSGYKTMIGALIAATPALANLMGYSVSGSFAGEASQLVDQIITLVGTVLAVYGRLVAQSPGWFAKQ